jgi:hypothetical protein
VVEEEKEEKEDPVKEALTPEVDMDEMINKVQD